VRFVVHDDDDENASMVFYRIVKRIPGGDASKVFFGTSLLLFIACAPRAYKETRRGHEFFSAERFDMVRFCTNARADQRLSTRACGPRRRTSTPRSSQTTSTNRPQSSLRNSSLLDKSTLLSS